MFKIFHFPSIQTFEPTGSELVQVPIVCHPHLAETGGRIPENVGRPTSHIVRTIRNKLSTISPSYEAIDSVDFSLLPSSWPNCEGFVHYFLEWLHDRPERNIAVVCHYNIIKRLLAYRVEHVGNCVPIECFMIHGDAQNLHLNLAQHNSNEQQSFSVHSKKKKS